MTNTNHNYRRARKTETPCRWCIYGLMRAGAVRVQCLLWGAGREERPHLRCGMAVFDASTTKAARLLESIWPPVKTDMTRLLAEVARLNKVSHYLAERLSPLNVTRRKYIGATLEDRYGNALFLTREEAIQSWLDEANREVSDAE